MQQRSFDAGNIVVPMNTTSGLQNISFLISLPLKTLFHKLQLLCVPCISILLQYVCSSHSTVPLFIRLLPFFSNLNTNDICDSRKSSTLNMNLEAH